MLLVKFSFFVSLVVSLWSSKQIELPAPFFLQLLFIFQLRFAPPPLSTYAAFLLLAPVIVRPDLSQTTFTRVLSIYHDFLFTSAQVLVTQQFISYAVTLSLLSPSTLSIKAITLTIFLQLRVTFFQLPS